MHLSGNCRSFGDPCPQSEGAKTAPGANSVCMLRCVSLGDVIRLLPPHFRLKGLSVTQAFSNTVFGVHLTDIYQRSQQQQQLPYITVVSVPDVLCAIDGRPAAVEWNTASQST